MYFRCKLSINRVMLIVREQCISVGKIHDLAESYNYLFIFFSILVKKGFQVEALRSTFVLFVAKNLCCSKMMMMMGPRKITNSLVVICILAF